MIRATYKLTLSATWDPVQGLVWVPSLAEQLGRFRVRGRDRVLGRLAAWWLVARMARAAL